MTAQAYQTRPVQIMQRLWSVSSSCPCAAEIAGPPHTASQRPALPQQASTAATACAQCASCLLWCRQQRPYLLHSQRRDLAPCSSMARTAGSAVGAKRRWRGHARLDQIRLFRRHNNDSSPLLLHGRPGVTSYFALSDCADMLQAASCRWTAGTGPPGLYATSLHNVVQCHMRVSACKGAMLEG